MKNLLISFLVISAFILTPIISFADGLYRGFGFDALTVDSEPKLQKLINLITEKNVNSFRVQYFNRDVDDNFENDADFGAEKYLTWVEDEVLPHYAWLKARFDQYNITTMISLHTPVGGREASSPPQDRMFLNEDLMDVQIEAWLMIAEIYNGDTSVIYQIFSEPATTGEKWKEFYTDLLGDISEISTESSEERQKVVIMPRYGNPALISGVDLEGLPSLFEYVLGVNMYAPFEYTHQRTIAVTDPSADFSYPSSVSVRSCDKQEKRWKKAAKKKRNKKKIRKLKRKYKTCLRQKKKEVKQAGEYTKDGLAGVLEKAIKSAKKKEVKLMIPEYAVVTYAEGAAEYLKDLTDVFDENEISSYYHILFEAGVWDPLMSCNPDTQSCEAVDTSDRFEELVDYFVNNEFIS